MYSLEVCISGVSTPTTKHAIRDALNVASAHVGLVKMRRLRENTQIDIDSFKELKRSGVYPYDLTLGIGDDYSVLGQHYQGLGYIDGSGLLIIRKGQVHAAMRAAIIHEITHAIGYLPLTSTEAGAVHCTTSGCVMQPFVDIEQNIRNSSLLKISNDTGGGLQGLDYCDTCATDLIANKLSIRALFEKLQQRY